MLFRSAPVARRIDGFGPRQMVLRFGVWLGCVTCRQVGNQPTDWCRSQDLRACLEAVRTALPVSRQCGTPEQRLTRKIPKAPQAIEAEAGT